MQHRFVPSVSTASYFEVLNAYLETHGCPAAFYSDKRPGVERQMELPRPTPGQLLAAKCTVRSVLLSFFHRY